MLLIPYHAPFFLCFFVNFFLLLFLLPSDLFGGAAYILHGIYEVGL